MEIFVFRGNHGASFEGKIDEHEFVVYPYMIRINKNPINDYYCVIVRVDKKSTTNYLCNGSYCPSVLGVKIEMREKGTKIKVRFLLTNYGSNLKPKREERIMVRTYRLEKGGD